MSLSVGTDRQAKATDSCRDWIKVSELFAFHLYHSQEWTAGFAD